MRIVLRAPCGRLRGFYAKDARYALCAGMAAGYALGVTNANRMLVVSPERWDEACFALPAARALAASGMQVGVFCPEEQEPFWQTLPEIAVVAHGPKPAAGDLGGEWDAALAWEHAPALRAVRAAGVVRRLAPAGCRKLQKWATDVIEAKPHVLQHRVRHYLATVEKLGIHTRDPAFFAPLAIGHEPVAGTVLLSPGSDAGPAYEWPIDRWAELGRTLFNDYGAGLTVAAVHGGRRRAAALVAALGGERDGVRLVDAHPLADSLPMLASHALVVAADGSLPHLAAHAGATCVVLYGPNDPAWRRPLGRRHAVVRHHVECAPCLMAKCPLDMRCQKRLQVAAVIRAVDPRLSRLLAAGIP